MALSFQALKDLWVQAGGNPAQAPIAAAIALAESGGNPQSHNGTPPDNSYGLWQINMLGAMGPARRSQFGLSSDAQLYDPLTNAKAAVAISSNGGNFGPWSTYTNGAYKAHLNGQGGGAQTASDTAPSSGDGLSGLPLNLQPLGAFGDLVTGGALTGGLGDIGGALMGIVKDLTVMANMFSIVIKPAFWLRVGAFFVGLLFLTMGSVSLFGAIKN